MVKVQEYRPGEYMINVTKSEALRLIKSLSTQLYNDNCNIDRAEFTKRRKDDVTYFSIAVDESTAKFHVMVNMGAGNPDHDVSWAKCDTIEDAQKFMSKFKDERIIGEYTPWIKEVQV